MALGLGGQSAVVLSHLDEGIPGMFTLPETLPKEIAALSELRSEAGKAYEEIKAKVDDGLSDQELADLRTVVDAIKTLDAATTAAQEAEQARRDEVSELLNAVQPVEEVGPEDEAEAPAEDAADVVAEAEEVAKEAAAPAVVAAGKAVAKTSFAGLARGKTPDLPKVEDHGWRMDPNVFGFKPGRVGFRQIAEAIDSVRPGSRPRGTRPYRGAFSAQTIARLDRPLTLVDDEHQLVDEIQRATLEKNLPGGSLTAAGGWCAPSETLYDFCEVPDAVDLLSLPEITIRRGGVRWPQEPDVSALETDDAFQFFFTETELEAVDGEGNPTAIKECIEIPCPDEFDELRLNAVGYCVEAGIPQSQGWPELIEWFLRKFQAAHFRAISKRTILTMVAGSGAVKVIPADSQLAAGSALLNSLELMAVNLRLQRGLSRTATIEGVAPSWLHAVVRADIANQAGMDVKNVTDAQINAWFSARNIALQYVADWQTKAAGLPGDLGTLDWPGTVDVLLYPAGTWFRAMSNVIEFGAMYPKEQLQVNRFTRFFTEDAIAVGKRCDQSILVRVPICPSGAIGARQTVACNTASTAVNEVQSIAATGTVSGGTFTATFDGQTTAAIAWNASAATIKTALDALSNLAPADTVLAGGALPGAPVTVTFVGAYGATDVPLLVIDDALITGGGSLDATVTTQGHS